MCLPVLVVAGGQVRDDDIDGVGGRVGSGQIGSPGLLPSLEERKDEVAERILDRIGELRRSASASASAG